MDNEKDCKVKACCRNHGCQILGVIFLIVGVILTLITLNGAGIFGMFIAGLVLCCHKHLCCKMCHCGCMNDSGACDTSAKVCVEEKKVAAKKS